MSEIAGRLDGQWGHLLGEAHWAVVARLIGGCTGVASRPAWVVLGGARVGWNAARAGGAWDAEVLLRPFAQRRLRTLESDRAWPDDRPGEQSRTLDRAAGLPTADLFLIGGLLTPGGPGANAGGMRTGAADETGQVIVDVAIDSGAGIATSRETTHTVPVVTIHGRSQHYAVGNMARGCPVSPHTEALVQCHAPPTSSHCRPRPA